MERSPITEDDKIWLNENHPDLHFDSDEQIIRGELSFRMYYSKNDPGYVINPDSSYESKDGVIVQDVYEIEIDLSRPRFLPAVREPGGRILESKEKWDIKNLLDLHVLPDGTLCLCVITEQRAKMPNGFNLKDFFENLLIPYFYYQSFFEQYGQEPWKGYGHGYLGILESYLDNRDNASSETITLYLDNLPEKPKHSIIKNVRIKGHHPCECNSKKKFRDCHKDALYGYNQLRNDYHKIKSKSGHQ